MKRRSPKPEEVKGKRSKAKCALKLEIEHSAIGIPTSEINKSEIENPKSEIKNSYV